MIIPQGEHVMLGFAAMTLFFAYAQHFPIHWHGIFFASLWYNTSLSFQVIGMARLSYS